MINGQVSRQLAYLKSLVDAEHKRERWCRKKGIPFEPSRRAGENLADYKEYAEEITRNGDKNLLKFVKISLADGLNMSGVFPFARRYATTYGGEYYLIHRTSCGSEIMLRESEANIVTPS